MKKLEQQKVREISLTDEKIYAKTKLKGRRMNRDRLMGLRKEVDKAMNEDNEAKKEAVCANEQKALTKYLKEVEGKINLQDINWTKYKDEEDKDERE
ncbi:Protein translocase subunit SecA, partial [Bienertia sinuspersici]